MTRADKAKIIDEISEKLSSSRFFYLADSSELSVAEINKFRSICYEKGIEYRIVKNTLIKKAMDKAKIDSKQFEDAGALAGFSGLMFAADEEAANAPAKAIRAYRKDGDKPLMKAAFIDEDLYLGDEHLKPLSELKSKDELIGEIIALLQSPAKNVISSLQSGKHKLAGIVKTLSEKEEK